MTLDQYASIAEIFGLILVIVTLVFLAVQTRQNTQAMRAGTSQAIHEQMSRFYNLLSENADLAEVFVKGQKDPDVLTPAETARFFSFWLTACLTFQNLVGQTREGIVGTDLTYALSRNLVNMSKAPGFQAFWAQRKDVFEPHFQAYVDNEILPKAPGEGFIPYYERA